MLAREPGLFENLALAAEGPPHGTDAHGRPVAPTAVRPGVAGLEPAHEGAPVPRPGVAVPEIVHGLGIPPAGQNGLGHGHREHGCRPVNRHPDEKSGKSVVLMGLPS